MRTTCGHNADNSNSFPVSYPNLTPDFPGLEGGVSKKTTTFADSENTAPSSTSAPTPLKPRARVVSARNVVSARLTTQAGNVLAAYQAAIGGGNICILLSSTQPNPIPINLSQ